MGHARCPERSTATLSKDGNQIKETRRVVNVYDGSWLPDPIPFCRQMRGTINVEVQEKACRNPKSKNYHLIIVFTLRIDFYIKG